MTPSATAAGDIPASGVLGSYSSNGVTPSATISPPGPQPSPPGFSLVYFTPVCLRIVSLAVAPHPTTPPIKPTFKAPDRCPSAPPEAEPDSDSDSEPDPDPEPEPPAPEPDSDSEPEPDPEPPAPEPEPDSDSD